MGVSDGDSLLLELPGSERVRVRLFGIDAPEKDQDFALTARKKLTRLVYDKPIRVEVQDIDNQTDWEIAEIKYKLMTESQES